MKTAGIGTAHRRLGCPIAAVILVSLLAAYPAAEAGVRVGDILVAVNATPATGHTLESLKTTMQGSGETCLLLRRDDTSREICFELRPMI